MAGKSKHSNDPNDSSRNAGQKTSSNGGMNASTGSTQDRQPSMGGSQGTRDEAREESRRNASSSGSRDQGGYGADSGYSDTARRSGVERPLDENDEKARRASGGTGKQSSSDRNSSGSRESSNDAPRRGTDGSGSHHT